MWCKFLLVAAVAAVVTPVSAQVTLEHIGGDTKVVRECDNLVFKFTVSGRFRRMYTVKVECFPAGAGAEDADFAGGVTSNSVKVSMEVPTVMVPLPLEHDNVIEGDEMFLCFVTANRGTRISAGRIKLTVLDDDINCPAGQTSRCGMVPPPTCDNPCPLNQTEHPCPLNQTEHPYPLNQTEHPYPLNQTEGVGCFCPYGMFARANGTCVTLENCIDCPAGQTARISRTAAPNCTNPNPTEELIKTLRCFCPPGMLAREDDTCVTPENCIDCPAGQTARISRTPAPNCTNPNQTEELIETLRCFCPPGMLVREDDTCVTPENCIDCPAGQTARRSKTPAPTCTNRNPPEEPMATLRCSCPDGMLITGGACVTPDGCGSATGSGVGDPHYRTYDGVFYDLFDHCSHVFTKDCTGDTFTVISITSNACSGGGAPTCVERAVIRVPELNTEVMLNSRPLEATFVGDTPASADLSLAVTNVITVNIFKLGVVVNFGLYYLSVTVPGRYFGNTCGLVGTYDGDPTNDFQLPNGTVVDGPTAEFEEAWRVDLPNDGCDPVDPQPAPPCEAAAQQQAEAFCAPLRGAAFTACHASVPPDQVFSDCVLDHCSCDTEVCGCSVIVNYAERCQALGITVGPLPAVCVPTCPMGMEYSICSPNVPPTCTNQVGQRDPCRPGCACPDGMVLRERDGQCVEPFLCEGTLVIPTNPGFRTCNALGDPHYTTFDGLAHHFQGVCYFNFACDCEEQLFHVYSKQERCFGGTVSCTTGAIIEVMGYTGRIEIGRNGAFSPDINTLPANIFKVSRVGNAYTVEILPLRVTVYYDGLWTINVKIPDAFDGRVCGLCGNSNQNPNDDFQALINGTLQQVTDLVQFGLSWANFDLADEFNCEVANAVPGPCEGSKRRRGEEFCMALRTKALDTGCIDHISPLEFINNCVFDYCAAETAPGTVDDMSGVCSHFVQYCARCAEVLGTATDLPPECLPTCPAGEDYKTCGPAQEGTCVAPEPVMQPGTCTPGCSCMEGFVRHEGNCINVTECPITASFQCNSYSVEEGDGICLPIKASGNLNRDFEVTVNLGRQLAADNTGDPTCSCRSQGDAQVCGGSDTCTVTLRAGEEYACVYVKIDGDDILEDNRTETLTLMPGDDAISIGDPSELEIRVIDDDFNALTFEDSAYYYTESRRLANNQRVQLSQAIEEPAFAELLLEGGDGDSAASAGRDFQSGVVQPYFPRGRRALFFVPIVRDRARESAECFYMTLSSPRDGESYDPVIRAWTPSRALGWIQGEIGRVPTRGRGGFACYHADNNPRDICNNDVVALVTFESEIDPKDCKLGWQATVRTVVKGAALVPQTAVNILVSAVSSCNRINFRRGEHYLVAGRLETAGGIGVFIHDVSVGQTGQVIWDSMQYAPMFQQIEEACA